MHGVLAEQVDTELEITISSAYSCTVSMDSYLLACLREAELAVQRYDIPMFECKLESCFKAVQHT